MRTNLVACWKHTGRVENRGVVPSHRGGTEPLYRLSELELLAFVYHRRVDSAVRVTTDDTPPSTP